MSNAVSIHKLMLKRTQSMNNDFIYNVYFMLKQYVQYIQRTELTIT